MTRKQPASIELKKVDVATEERERLHNIDLDIFPGELFVVLGPTGAQKTALLRAIAGLEPVVSGSVHVDGKDITGKPVERRGMTIMLGGFPLWANMNVIRNIAFPLRAQGVSRGKADERSRQMLHMVGLDEFANHMPQQLSGSQRQRVALARTLAMDADAHLLDEPFSAQDPQIRDKLIRLVRRQQQQSGTTMVVTTQDPFEALRLGDRVAVLSNGELQQIGSPRTLYDTPANRAVAETLGDSNLIEGEIEYAGDQPLFHAENGLVIPVFERALKRAKRCTAMFRPGDVVVIGGDEAPFGDRIRIVGRVEQSEFRGDRIRYAIELSGTTIWMDAPRRDHPQVLDFGEQVVLGIDPARIRFLT